MSSNIFVPLKKGGSGAQLICFPYLGGYANSYCELARFLDDDIEVLAANPPGHGNSKLPLKDHIEDVVLIYAAELKRIMKPGCIFFGHSMGGVLAYIMIDYLKKQGAEIFPELLFLSASGTPYEFHDKKYSELKDKELIDKLIAYGGMPDEVLQSQELLAYLLPVFRADYKVLESAAQAEYGRIDTPAYLLWGDKDAVETFDSALQWSLFFEDNIRIIPINGGRHMFIHDRAETVAEQIQSRVKEFRCELPCVSPI